MMQNSERFGTRYALFGCIQHSMYQVIREGKFSALVVQPQQLSMMAGHLPRLARLVSQDQQFRKRIVRVHVDEAHFIHTAGCGVYGLAAF
jgi:superfamily II DNA helicase RecQ